MTRSSIFSGVMVPGAQERVSACGSLCSRETNVEVTYLTSLGILPRLLSPRPHCPRTHKPFPRPVEFEEFEMIQ